MARVTVEDCIEKLPNRFDLVVVAAERSREITKGAMLTVDRDNDKNPVVALREIAEDFSTAPLKEAVIKSFQKHVALDESEQEMAEMLANELEPQMSSAEEVEGLGAQPIILEEGEAADGGVTIEDVEGERVEDIPREAHPEGPAAEHPAEES